MCAKRTILIVDDEEDVLETLSTTLSSTKCNILCANNATEAFDIIVDEFVDVLITDIRMPKESGFELLDNILSLPPADRPVIFVISGAEEFTREHIERYQVTMFFQKPFSLDRFAVDVKQAIARLK